MDPDNSVAKAWEVRVRGGGGQWEKKTTIDVKKKLKMKTATCECANLQFKSYYCAQPESAVFVMETILILSLQSWTAAQQTQL